MTDFRICFIQAKHVYSFKMSWTNSLLLFGQEVDNFTIWSSIAVTNLSILILFLFPCRSLATTKQLILNRQHKLAKIRATSFVICPPFNTFFLYPVLLQGFLITLWADKFEVILYESEVIITGCFLFFGQNTEKWNFGSFFKKNKTLCWQSQDLTQKVK